jgi:hypothetical protein
MKTIPYIVEADDIRNFSASICGYCESCAMICRNGTKNYAYNDVINKVDEFERLLDLLVRRGIRLDKY